MRLIDISPALSASTPVWPGDTAFSARRTMAIGPGCPVNVSAIALSTHTGAHADAPLHYDARGAAIDAVALEPYIGPATVIHAIGAPALTAALLARLLPPDCAPRVLVRFYEHAPQCAWDSGFAAVEADAVRLLAARGALLVGVDTPSLDPQESKTMDAHAAIRDAGMRILEGLVLDGVAAGDYELIAPPLKLAGLDAAPVRAVLRTKP